jgi:hypothetical protein
MSSEQQVTVRGAPAAIKAWLQTLAGPITEVWSRATDIEQKVRANRDARWPICLVWSGGSDHPRTAIFLQPVSDSEVGVMSVVGIDRRELTPEDRTAALQSFRDAMVVPQGNELRLTERPAFPGLSELISPQAQARFTAFARTANKASLHSGLDLPRWDDFLIQLHRDGASPPREAVEAALNEEAFSSEVIKQLMDHYECTEETLNSYDTVGDRE